MRTSSRPAGFTVVELLAILAILTVLAALVLPALARAQERSRTVSCLGHMKKIGQALLLHAQDRGGQFPRSSHSAGANRETAWATSIAPYLGAKEGEATAAWVNREFRCPANTNASPTAYSYGLNVFFELQPGDSYVGRPATWRRTMQVPSPGRTILLAEVATASAGMTADHFMCHQWSSTAAARNAVAGERHSGGSHYLFVDGHVESMRVEETFVSRQENRWNPSLAGQQ